MHTNIQAGSLGLAYVLGHAVGLEPVEIPVAMFTGAHKVGSLRNDLKKCLVSTTGNAIQ
jgi:hypothetical protein